MFIIQSQYVLAKFHENLFKSTNFVNSLTVDVPFTKARNKTSWRFVNHVWRNFFFSWNYKPVKISKPKGPPGVYDNGPEFPGENKHIADAFVWDAKRLLTPPARFFVISFTEMGHWFLLWKCFVYFSFVQGLFLRMLFKGRYGWWIVLTWRPLRSSELWRRVTYRSDRVCGLSSLGTRRDPRLREMFFLHISYNIKIALNRSRFIFLVAGQWRPSIQYNYMF